MVFCVCKGVTESIESTVFLHACVLSMMLQQQFKLNLSCCGSAWKHRWALDTSAQGPWGPGIYQRTAEVDSILQDMFLTSPPLPLRCLATIATVTTPVCMVTPERQSHWLSTVPEHKEGLSQRPVGMLRQHKCTWVLECEGTKRARKPCQGEQKGGWKRQKGKGDGEQEGVNNLKGAGFVLRLGDKMILITDHSKMMLIT